MRLHRRLMASVREIVTTVTNRNHFGKQTMPQQASTSTSTSTQYYDRDNTMQLLIDGAPNSAPETDSPFNHVMKTWARWMTLRDQQTSEGLSNPQDVKEFMSCGEAVDLMIDALPRVQWWAIRKAWGITTVWRFPDQSLADAIVAAERNLSVKMSKNVATRRYFN